MASWNSSEIVAFVSQQNNLTRTVNNMSDNYQDSDAALALFTKMITPPASPERMEEIEVDDSSAKEVSTPTTSSSTTESFGKLDTVIASFRDEARRIITAKDEHTSHLEEENRCLPSLREKAQLLQTVEAQLRDANSELVISIQERERISCLFEAEKERVQQLETQKEEVSGQLETITEEWEELNVLYEEEKKERERATEETQRCQTALEAAQGEAAELSGQLQRTQAQVTDVTDHLQRAEQALVDKEKMMEENKLAWERERGEYEVALVVLREQNNTSLREKDQRIDQLLRQLSKESSQDEAVRAAQEELHKEIAALMSQNEKLSDELQHCREQKKTTDDSLTATQDLVDRLQSQLLDLQSSLDISNRQMEDLQRSSPVTAAATSTAASHPSGSPFSRQDDAVTHAPSHDQTFDEAAEQLLMETTLRQQKEEAEYQLSSFKSRMLEYKQEIASVRQQLSKYEKADLTLRRQLDKQMVSFRTELAFKEAEIKTLAAAIHSESEGEASGVESDGEEPQKKRRRFNIPVEFEAMSKMLGNRSVRVDGPTTFFTTTPAKIVIHPTK
ncbi:kinesin [Planoprotostelium fungivorum]|uniref:Kinesin n=1 Tax=Planoprotostelium fungivorum TaxID=1890364 RepID=A0A2P6MRR8_9EUKA|nr:kinesin [Planoprotostelium fungivorum]